MKLRKMYRNVLICIIIMFSIIASVKIANASNFNTLRNRVEQVITKIEQVKSSNSILNKILNEISDEIAEDGSEQEENTETQNDKKYNVQMELNILDINDTEIIGENRLKITEDTEETDEKNKLDINIFDSASGELMTIEDDGSFITKDKGVIIDLNNLEKNKKYKILIENIEVSEEYNKLINNLKLEVSIDENENIVAQISEATDASGEKIDILKDVFAKLHKANEDGVLTIQPDKQDENIEIQYKIGDTNQWENYTSGVKIRENNTIYAKAIKGDVESDITLKKITNIDKDAPTVENILEQNDEITNETTITATLKDNASGIVKYGISNSNEIQPEKYISADPDLTEDDIKAHRNTNPKREVTATINEIYENGTYYLWVWDTAGNHTAQEIEITSVKDTIVAIITEASEEHKDLINTTYSRLYKAIAACPTDGSSATVTLVAEIFNEHNEIENRKVTLNLNGNKVNCNSVETPTFTINSDSSLTVINVDDDKVVQNSGSINSENTTAILVKDGGTLTLGINDRRVLINQPEINGKSKGVENEDNGTFNFYDGVITSTVGKDEKPSSFTGKIADTPVAYSPAVTTSAEEDLKIEKATLAVIAGIEAKIGGKTFTQIETAIEEARSKFWSRWFTSRNCVSTRCIKR